MMKTVTVASLLTAVCTDALCGQCTLTTASYSAWRGTDGAVTAVRFWDPDGPGPATKRVVVGGDFGAAGSVSVANIATYDPATRQWAAMGTGVDNGVKEIDVLADGRLCVAGDFGTAGGLTVNRMAIWDGASWAPFAPVMPLGPIDEVLVASNGDVIVGGGFSQVGTIAANNIARWNGTSWSNMGGGMTGLFGTSIAALAQMPNGDIIAGGTFSSAGGIPANYIARWNGTSWSPLGSGMNSGVFALGVTTGGTLVAGGTFTTAGGTAANRIAAWNGTTWTPLGSGLNQSPTAMFARANGDLVVGGYFTMAGGIAAIGLAVWNGTSWSPFSTPSGGGPALTVDGTTTVVGGSFLSVGGVNARNVAIHDGAGWSALTDGFSRRVVTLTALREGGVLVGGDFELRGPSERYVTKFAGGSWQSLGGGVGNQVSDTAQLPNGDVVVGGAFVTAGGSPISNLARWDGLSWSSMGASFVPPSFGGSPVTCLLATSDGGLVVGGDLNPIGGVPANGIARWSSGTWTVLGTGLNGSAIDMVEVENGNIVVVGNFTSAGGIAAARIARWNGSSWSPLGLGIGTGASAIVRLPSGDLVVGGSLSMAGGAPVARIARWNGASWSQLGGGLTGNVSDLLVLPNGDLLAAGSFSSVGGVSSVRLARWDGATWTAVGTGADGSLLALTLTYDGLLMIGGEFENLNGVVSPFLAGMSSGCAATASAFGSGCNSSAGSVAAVATNVPWLGSRFRALTSGIPAPTFAVSIWGLTTTSVALPSVLPQSASGCVLLVSPDYLNFVPAPASVLATEIVIPVTTSLTGRQFHHQVAPLEFGPAGISLVSVSNGLTLTIGSF